MKAKTAKQLCPNAPVWRVQRWAVKKGDHAGKFALMAVVEVGVYDTVEEAEEARTDFNKKLYS